MIQGNKRLKGESFKKYKARLKDEAKKIKSYLKGRYIWLSKDLYNLPMERLDRVVIAKGLGTYRRSMGAIGTKR